MKIILQVEDDPNDVFFFQYAMRKAGVANRVEVVADGQMAIDYLRGAGAFSDRSRFPFPSLVLLDLKLPYVMGLDVLKWIRQQVNMSLAVVVLTASAEARDVRAAYGLGANGFLVKPTEARKFEEMVRAIRDFWLTSNRMPGELAGPGVLGAVHEPKGPSIDSLLEPLVQARALPAKPKEAA